MWDERFAEDGFAYGEEPNDFLREWAPRLPRGRTLCLAEGQGRNAVFLASLGHSVTAVDWSETGLAKARALAEHRGVKIRTVQADLAEHPIEPSAWDVIVAIFAHVPPDLRRRIHADCVRGLAPGGMMILVAYTPAQLSHGTGGPKDPALLMTKAGVMAELAGLDFLHAEECEREVREGRYHVGHAAIVQVAARKPAR